MLRALYIVMSSQVQCYQDYQWLAQLCVSSGKSVDCHLVMYRASLCMETLPCQYTHQSVSSHCGGGTWTSSDSPELDCSNHLPHTLLMI